VKITRTVYYTDEMPFPVINSTIYSIGPPLAQHKWFM